VNSFYVFPLIFSVQNFIWYAFVITPCKFHVPPSYHFHLIILTVLDDELLNVQLSLSSSYLHLLRYKRYHHYLSVLNHHHSIPFLRIKDEVYMHLNQQLLSNLYNWERVCNWINSAMNTNHSNESRTDNNQEDKGWPQLFVISHVVDCYIVS
jgi:hypothetical protein